MDVQRVLILEDDDTVANILELHLKECGFSVIRAKEGDIALKLGLSGNFHLMIVDASVPGISGFEVCKRIRVTNRELPVMFLTSKNSEADKVNGLEIGADDYVTKPFSPKEIVARVKALLRRTTPLAKGASNTTLGSLMIDRGKRKVELAGKVLDLTATEFDLLSFLTTHPGKSYSRSELLKAVWGYTHEGYEHTVNTHINRLRNKLESDPNNPIYIKTVWGVGYRSSEADECA